MSNIYYIRTLKSYYSSVNREHDGHPRRDVAAQRHGVRTSDLLLFLAPFPPPAADRERTREGEEQARKKRCERERERERTKADVRIKLLADAPARGPETTQQSVSLD